MIVEINTSLRKERLAKAGWSNQSPQIRGNTERMAAGPMWEMPEGEAHDLRQ